MFPTVSSPPEELADWLELQAVQSGDRNSSIQDLVRALRRSGTTDALVEDEEEDEDGGYASDPGSEKTQAAAEGAFSEVEERRSACVPSPGMSRYPFEVADGYLSLSDGDEQHVYLFLLLLSIFGRDAGPAGVRGDDLFDDVCAEALKWYFGGPPPTTAVVFGFPRRVLPAGFRAAVDQLCRDIGEGGSCRDRPTRKSQKDAKLDIVAWRDFPDGRHGKLIGFGQCATGANWPDKVTELLPLQFCQKWLRDLPTVLPIRAFFVPFRIERSRWSDTCIDAGIVFDRCRIAGSLHSPPLDLVRRCRKWVRHVVEQSMSGSATAARVRRQRRPPSRKRRRTK